jgi:hypothetical protein
MVKSVAVYLFTSFLIWFVQLGIDQCKPVKLILYTIVIRFYFHIFQFQEIRLLLLSLHKYEGLIYFYGGFELVKFSFVFLKVFELILLELLDVRL